MREHLLRDSFISGLILPMFVSAGSPASPVAAPIQGRVTVELLPWRSACKSPSPGEIPECGIPQPASAPIEPVTLKLAAVHAPGQAQSVFRDFQSALAGRIQMKGRITIYSVFPHVTQSLPPYVQVRLEIAEPVRVLCLESVRWKTPMEIPPLICSGYAEGGMNPLGTWEQWGITTVMHF